MFTKRRILWLLVIITILLSFKSPTTGVLTMGLVVYLLKDKFVVICDHFSLRTAFLGSGIFFGILTELFGILGNLHLPLAQRALLNPYPLADLTLAFFWYGLFMLTWYILLKRYDYSFLGMFIVAGIYGLAFEQGGVFFASMITSIPGFIIGLFVMSVYAFFPMLAYMLTKHRFPERKETSKFIRYPIALLGLTLHILIWKIAGFIYYPILTSLGLFDPAWVTQAKTPS